jgi:cysteine sulfinate desulfinase/cysteine desulfurase-like protein
MLLAGMYKSFQNNFIDRLEKNKIIFDLKNYFIKQLYENFQVKFYEDIENDIKDIQKPFILIISPKKSFYHIVLFSLIRENSCNSKYKKILEDNHILCSTASVCQTDSLKASFVLDALGIEKKEIKKGVLRWSLSEFNTKKEIDYAVEVLKKISIMNL